jgi:hypothetical protein
VDGDSTSRASTKRWHAPCDRQHRDPPNRHPPQHRGRKTRALLAPVPVCSWSEPYRLSRSALRPVFAPPGTRWQSRKMRGPAFLLSRVNPRAPKPARENRGFPPMTPREWCRMTLRGAPTACGRSPPPSRIQATEPTARATPWVLPPPAWVRLGLRSPTQSRIGIGIPHLNRRTYQPIFQGRCSASRRSPLPKL